jgi:hypothetical protein
LLPLLLLLLLLLLQVIKGAAEVKVRAQPHPSSMRQIGGGTPANDTPCNITFTLAGRRPWCLCFRQGHV